MCDYCETYKYLKDTLTPNSGFRSLVLEHGRRYGSGKYTGKSAYTLLVNYRTPYGNGMMSEFVPINNCPMCGRELANDGTVSGNCIHVGEEGPVCPIPKVSVILDGTKLTFDEEDSAKFVELVRGHFRKLAGLRGDAK